MATEGTVTLYHATRSERLVEIERTLVVPATVDDDGKRRVYVASDPAIAEVIPHAEGAVAIEVDVALDFELGMGDSPDRLGGARVRGSGHGGRLARGFGAPRLVVPSR